ncbi:hypothetical protein [Frankia sp. QA3]|uniref:hypothetical protein n=1 Tax=Frankia sp. QA3 TaxID=710111 RepID=UPI0018DEE32B|nr:hypothetical protein [Frankia sp. QA3]
MDNLARESCARFMSETADLFEQIRGIVEGAPGVGDRSALIAALRGINGARGQVALENVRISSSMAVVECSQDLWKHLRSKSVPQGSVSPERFREWKGEYWDLRKSLINQVRLDLGVRGRLGQEESD